MTDEKTIEKKTARAMVATYMQVARSTELARYLQQSRERTLERRAEKSEDLNEVLKIQRQLDAQQAQSAVIESASERLRGQAERLAEFSKAGLTIEDMKQMGVDSIVEIEELQRAMASKRSGTAEPEEDPQS